MKTIPILLLTTLLPLAPLEAHHSFAAEFDSSKPVTLQGTVTKVAWMNPHVFLWVDVADSSGKVTNWEVESSSPNGLLGVGWNKFTLKAGDPVTIEGYRAKDQDNLAKTFWVTLPGGKRVFTGSQK